MMLWIYFGSCELEWAFFNASNILPLARSLLAFLKFGNFMGFILEKQFLKYLILFLTLSSNLMHRARLSLSNLE